VKPLRSHLSVYFSLYTSFPILSGIALSFYPVPLDIPPVYTPLLYIIPPVYTPFVYITPPVYTPHVYITPAMVGNNWDTTMCHARTHLVLRQTFVECSCNQLGAMGVATDVPRGYGWTLPAGLSAALCVLAVLFSIILHLVYRSGTLLASRLFVCVSFSTLLFQVATPTSIHWSLCMHVCVCVSAGAASGHLCQSV